MLPLVDCLRWEEVYIHISSLWIPFNVFYVYLLHYDSILLLSNALLGKRYNTTSNTSYTRASTHILSLHSSLIRLTAVVLGDGVFKPGIKCIKMISCCKTTSVV